MKNEERRVNFNCDGKDKIYDVGPDDGDGCALPMQAQDVNEDEVDRIRTRENCADSTLIDSLATDTCQKLPWPVSVQVGLDKLLESKMFETSQVGLMVWDLEADSLYLQEK